LLLNKKERAELNLSKRGPAGVGFNPARKDFKNDPALKRMKKI